MKETGLHSLPNIILIGLMGCGKTTVGKELYRETKLHFTDTDQLIERQTGMNIPHIFRTYGEEYFRDLETQTLRRMWNAGKRNRIISTGGGIIIRHENRLMLPQLGFVVWLNTDLDTLFQRISRCTNRPLLQQPNPKDVLERLMQERSALYRETAHLTIDTANLHIHEIAFGILESAKVFARL